VVRGGGGGGDGPQAGGGGREARPVREGRARGKGPSPRRNNSRFARVTLHCTREGKIAKLLGVGKSYSNKNIAHYTGSRIGNTCRNVVGNGEMLYGRGKTTEHQRKGFHTRRAGRRRRGVAQSDDSQPAGWGDGGWRRRRHCALGGVLIMAVAFFWEIYIA